MGTLFAFKVSEQNHEMVRSIQYQKTVKPNCVTIHIHKEQNTKLGDKDRQGDKEEKGNPTVCSDIAR